MKITGAQRSFLKKKAHHLAPDILIGRHGMTDQLVSALDEALEAHELVKVKFNEFKSEKKAIAAELAERTNSEYISLVGNVLTLFRWQEDDQKRKIELP